MKRAWIVALIVLFSSTAAMAWGKKGHAVIAALAESALTPPALNAAHELLALEGSTSLGEVASWADAVKKEKRWPRHTTRIPLDADAGTNCGHRRPCATDGIRTYLDVLDVKAAATQQRLEALKMIVHLVGDIHQPLHATENIGTHIPITFDGRNTTLHRFWDVVVLSRTSTKQLIDLLKNQMGTKVEIKSPMDWAIESRNIARDFISRI